MPDLLEEDNPLGTDLVLSTKLFDSLPQTTAG